MTVPPALLNSIKDVPGFDEAAFENAHEVGTATTSIRLNRAKANASEPILDYAAIFPASASMPVPWASDGYSLSNRPSFTADPMFHAGLYYVQEASSMFLEQVLKQSADLSQPLKVLDLCAAPGGKSTLIQSLISPESLLVSNEVIKSRVPILAENLCKWGQPNVIITNNDPRDFGRVEGYFDVIVVDAPCSGSGLFRKDPAAINEWSPENVQLCSQRQQRILGDIIPALKEGGLLVYSTCSFSKEENEDICDWVMQHHPLSSLRCHLEENWHIVESSSDIAGAYGYRFYPDQLMGEGFFIAALRKERDGGSSRGEQVKIRKGPERLSKAEIEVIKPWIKNPGEFFYIRQHDESISLPLHVEKNLPELQSALYLKKAGIKLGTIIRNELIPAHELAMSAIRNDSIPSIEVDRQTALQYLRRQNMDLHPELKGWALINYSHAPLGWVKVLPGRINNYYPKEWRILNK